MFDERVFAHLATEHVFLWDEHPVTCITWIILKSKYGMLYLDLFFKGYQSHSEK